MMSSVIVTEHLDCCMRQVCNTFGSESESNLYFNQSEYTSGHLKFKAIQDFSRLFQIEIQDCFNDICTFKCSKLS